MLDLIEPMLSKRKAGFVRLDGSVPQTKGQGLVDRFQRTPADDAFLADECGQPGLNFQAANTIINVDLPWNLVLEQKDKSHARIAWAMPARPRLSPRHRRHDRGRGDAHHTLSEAGPGVCRPRSVFRKDGGFADRNIDELKRKLEALTGVKPPAPVDESEKLRVNAEARKQRRESVALAGGELLAAAFAFVRQAMASEERGSVAACQAVPQRR